MEIISNSEEETRSIAQKFAKELKRGDIICLFGELGSGKTTFIQGLAQGLGIEKRILSPSFVLMRQYPMIGFEFVHIDLFRLEDVADIHDLGLDELLKSEKNIIAIEWAQRIEKFLPKRRIEVKFSYVGDRKRKINIRRIG